MPEVAIIGAGVSGLAVCKTLTEAGVPVVVYEARGSIGGIWSNTYASTTLQTPRSSYCFSDWPWPDDAPMHPSHDQVIHYLQGYIDHFRLRSKISLSSKVLEMKRVDGRDGWMLRVDQARQSSSRTDSCSNDSSSSGSSSSSRSGSSNGASASSGSAAGTEGEWRYFKHVIVCSGCFGDVPRPLQFPPSKGPEAFQGTVLHSAKYSELSREAGEELMRGRRVVVVGFQKTGIDVSIEAAEANSGPGGVACTLLFRRAHWIVPRSGRVFGIPLPFFFLTRLSELGLPKPGQHPLVALLQRLSPMRWVTSKLVELYMVRTYPLRKHGLVPSHSFSQDLAACILPQLPDKFFPLIEQGRILLKRSASWHFTPAGMRLENGEELAADVVLLCTGYNGLAKVKAMLPEPYSALLEEEGESLHLYRGLVHPRIPDVAFLGFHEGLSSMHVAEMGARWLTALLRGGFSLPSAAAMDAERAEWRRYKRAQTPFSQGRVSCIAPLHVWHFDALCRDMGWPLMRKRGLLQNLLLPYGSVDYRAPAPPSASPAPGPALTPVPVVVTLATGAADAAAAKADKEARSVHAHYQEQRTARGAAAALASATASLTAAAAMTPATATEVGMGMRAGAATSGALSMAAAAVEEEEEGEGAGPLQRLAQGGIAGAVSEGRRQHQQEEHQQQQQQQQHQQRHLEQLEQLEQLVMSSAAAAAMITPGGEPEVPLLQEGIA